jgi:hypothetical protein
VSFTRHQKGRMRDSLSNTSGQYEDCLPSSWRNLRYSLGLVLWRILIFFPSLVNSNGVRKIGAAFSTKLFAINIWRSDLRRMASDRQNDNGRSRLISQKSPAMTFSFMHTAPGCCCSHVPGLLLIRRLYPSDRRTTGICRLPVKVMPLDVLQSCSCEFHPEP